MSDQINDVVDNAMFEVLNKQLFIQGGITTVIVIGFVLVARFILVNFIRGKKEILDKEQRRWINRVNNGTTVLLLVSLLFIWAPQIHTFALSLTAVAVAIVLTTKELLMCLTGGLLRTSTKPFDIGDWIVVDGMTGEVMRITAMTTQIEEIDIKEQTYQFTGHTIQIPNSKFLTSNIDNANFLKTYIYSDIPITIQNSELDPSILMKKLKEIVDGYFEPFKKEAVKFNKKIEKKSAVDFADPDPQFFLRTTDIGHSVFIVRFLVPTYEAAKLKTDITHDFLSFFFTEKQKLSQISNEKDDKKAVPKAKK